MSPKTILIIDDSLVQLKALSMKLGARGYEVLTAADSTSALTLVRQQTPDLIILDVNFPTDSWDGFSLIAWFRRMEQTKDLPIVVISGSDRDNCAQRCRDAGAIAFFLKPIDHDLLLTTLRQALHQSTEEQASVALPAQASAGPPPVPLAERPSSILLVEDDKSLAETLEFFLQSEGFRVTWVADGAKALEAVQQGNFDIVVTDMVMPHFNGAQFYQAVEQINRELCRRFIFMTGHQADPRSDLFIRRLHALMLWKPFPLCDLLTAIEVVWRKNRAPAPAKPSLTFA